MMKDDRSNFLHFLPGDFVSVCMGWCYMYHDELCLGCITPHTEIAKFSAGIVITVSDIGDASEWSVTLFVLDSKSCKTGWIYAENAKRVTT